MGIQDLQDNWDDTIKGIDASYYQKALEIGIP